MKEESGRIHIENNDKLHRAQSTGQALQGERRSAATTRPSSFTPPITVGSERDTDLCRSQRFDAAGIVFDDQGVRRSLPSTQTDERK